MTVFDSLSFIASRVGKAMGVAPLAQTEQTIARFLDDHWAREPDLAALREALWRQLVAVDMRRRQVSGERYNREHPGDPYPRHILDANPPWRSVQPPSSKVPGMISEEEQRYYHWLGSQYSGSGEVVELGPWLGLSTFHIVMGLRKNPRFEGRRVYVYEDFVWRSSWMDASYAGPDRPGDHEDFLPLFQKFCGDLASWISAERRRLSVGALEEDFGRLIDPYDKCGSIPHLSWDRGPIELLYVDVGRTIAVNEAWYSVLSPFLLPGRSLVVMQDWRTCREVPEKWYNQTRQFTDGKHETMEMVHELSQGGTATFRWKGKG
jgi:hypothetical protein